MNWVFRVNSFIIVDMRIFTQSSEILAWLALFSVGVIFHCMLAAMIGARDSIP